MVDLSRFVPSSSFFLPLSLLTPLPARTGADPTARDSSSLSFFHLALLLSHLSILTSFLESSPPPFPAPDGAEELSSYSSDAFYPLPRGHSSLLSLALAGGVGKGGKHSLERVKAVRETVKASLPFSGGREIRQGWKKVEGEVKRVPSKKENVRNEWEEVKWAMAERAKQLNFDEVRFPLLSFSSLASFGFLGTSRRCCRPN